MNKAHAADSARDEHGRQRLLSLADEFLRMILTGDVSRMVFTPHSRMTINGNNASVVDPRFRLITDIPYHQYVADAHTRQVAFFGVAAQERDRGTLFVRLAEEAGGIAEAEVILGTRLEDGVPGLISPNPLFDYVLPVDQRRSRAELIAIADSYFEGLQRHDGSAVPVSHDCRRFEDGVQTSLNPVFMPAPANDFSPYGYIERTSGRAYPIVDVARGLVLGQMVIEVPTPRGPPANSNRRPVDPKTGMVMPPSELRSKPRHTVIQELFKVIGGNITEIQTIRLDRPYGSGDGWRTLDTRPCDC